jgi:hypothetical protein
VRAASSPSVVGGVAAMDFLTEEAAIGTVEAWIEKLFECKPLTEGEVKQLCDKVR